MARFKASVKKYGLALIIVSIVAASLLAISTSSPLTAKDPVAAKIPTTRPATAAVNATSTGIISLSPSVSTGCSASFCIFSSQNYYYAVAGVQQYAFPIGTIVYGGNGSAGGIPGTNFAAVINTATVFLAASENGGSISLSAGTFNATSTLITGAGVSWSGASMASTVILGNSGLSPIVYVPAGSDHMSINDLAIEGGYASNHNSTNNICLQVGSSSNSAVGWDSFSSLLLSFCKYGMAFYNYDGNQINFYNFHAQTNGYGLTPSGVCCSSGGDIIMGSGNQVYFYGMDISGGQTWNLTATSSEVGILWGDAINRTASANQQIDFFGGHIEIDTGVAMEFVTSSPADQILFQGTTFEGASFFINATQNLSDRSHVYSYSSEFFDDGGTRDLECLVCGGGLTSGLSIVLQLNQPEFSGALQPGFKANLFSTNFAEILAYGPLHGNGANITLIPEVSESGTLSFSDSRSISIVTNVLDYSPSAQITIASSDLAGIPYSVTFKSSNIGTVIIEIAFARRVPSSIQTIYWSINWTPNPDT